MRSLRTWLRKKRRRPAAAPAELGSGFSALYECDSLGVATLTPDGRFLTTNKGLQRMLGYDEVELAGLSLGKVTHPEDMSRCADEFEKLKRRETDNFMTEKRYLRKDGAPLWTHIVVAAVHERGELLHTVEIAMDITRRKRAEEDVLRLKADLETRVKQRTAELEFNTALLYAEQDASPDGIVVVDYGEEKVVAFNRRFVEMWEISPEIAASRSLKRFQEHIFPRLTDPESARKRMEGSRLRPDEKTFYDLSLTDGRTIEVSGAPISGANGRYYGRVVYCHDVTRRLLAEAQLREKSEALSRSNVDLDMFAYAAAHDLNAPLRRVIGFGDLLRENLKDRLDPESSNLLTRMQESATGMSKLINDVLSLARIGREPLPAEDVDLNLLTAGVISDLQGQIDEAGVVMETRPLPTIHAHPTLMRRVIQNLITNAVKFRAPNSPRVRLDSRLLEGGFVELSISDNGIGFEQKDAERIFEPFVRLHPASEYLGSGIGLAICRRIAERYGGRMSAESEPGKDTVFRLALPAAILAGKKG